MIAILGQSFALDAGRALLKYRKVVAADIHDYKEAKAEEQYLVAGMKVGDIGRIIVWGSPSE